MESIHNSFLALVIALSIAAGSAYAQQPPDVVTSDVQGNTAMGSDALIDLAGGASNTASGAYTLLYNTTGDYNTASGVNALQGNSTGSENSAFGADALYLNNGSNNVAVGTSALFTNASGNYNTACGVNALFSNTTGNSNTACAYEALFRNTTGVQNTASGVSALHNNSSGDYNSAFGVNALYNNTKGSSNIAEGYKAGFNLTTGSNNIDIGNEGVAADSGIIRIGTKSTHTATYIAGIYATSVSGNPVMVSSSGQLGVVVSSERFKTGITPMGASSDKLQQLRPVTFHLKTDPNGALQYGLIAEEVAKVYPELVIRSESGRIDGVRYDELAPLLLNEVQQLQRKMAAQDEKIASLGERNAAQTAEIHKLRERQNSVLRPNRPLSAARVDGGAEDSQPGGARSELIRD